MASLPSALIAPYIFLIVATFVITFALITFSPIGRFRQPGRSLLMGVICGGLAGLSSIPVVLSDDPPVSLRLLIISVPIMGVVGALIGLLGSAEGISTKTKDDFSPRRGDDQWHVDT
jgi:hypothetical protein